jgi:hypothetical protein
MMVVGAGLLGGAPYLTTRSQQDVGHNTQVGDSAQPPNRVALILSLIA